MLRCPACFNVDVEIRSLPYPLFRHLDFQPIGPGPAQLAACRACGSVFRDMNNEEAGRINAVYRSEEYTRHNKPHMLVVEDFDRPVTLAFLQAELLAELIPERDARVLDFGCFNGELLREIAARRPAAADLCGFDVERRLSFPAGTPFRLVTGSLEAVTGGFDLIAMSHSLQYVRDQKALFERLRRLLRPGGSVFIQVPNFMPKPCSLLLGDVHYHYTLEILLSVLQRFGFAAQGLANRWFSRDVLIIAWPDVTADHIAADSGATLRDAATRLRAMAASLDAITAPKLAVLGTTIEAAFANTRLGDRLAIFVDENPLKVGTSFGGKPVIHPKDLRRGDQVLLPMGEAGREISERLTRRYAGNFVCV